MSTEVKKNRKELTDLQKRIPEQYSAFKFLFEDTSNHFCHFKISGKNVIFSTVINMSADQLIFSRFYFRKGYANFSRYRNDNILKNKDVLLVTSYCTEKKSMTKSVENRGSEGQPLQGQK